MGTPALQWSQLLGSMLNQGAASTVQGMRVGQQQQQLQMQQQAEERANREADLQFHQHLSELGALPVVNGLVKDTVDMPTLHARIAAENGGDLPPLTSQLLNEMAPVTAQGGMTVLRKADPSRTVKFTDATGDQVAYEIPSVGSQAWRQAQAARAQAVGQQAQAEAQGRLAAEQQQRDTYGTPLSSDLAEQYGVDPNQKFLPSEKVTLATRYNPVRAADLRGQATTTAAETRADAAKYAADLRSQTQQAITDQKSMDAQEALRHKDAWNSAIVAARNNAQTNLNARAFAANGERNMELHNKLLGDISKETTRQMTAMQLLATGPDGKPVTADGDQYTDPFTSRKTTMNTANRLLLQNGLNQSQVTVQGYKQNAATLENLRDQILNRFAGGTPAASGASVSPGAPSPGTPSTSVPGLQPRPGGSLVSPTAPSTPSPSTTPSAPSAPQASTPGVPRPGDPGSRPSILTNPDRTGLRPSLQAGGGRANAQAAAPQAGSGSASQPAATPRAKTATRAQVQAYAEKKGISIDAALKEFQASNYTVR